MFKKKTGSLEGKIISISEKQKINKGTYSDYLFKKMVKETITRANVDFENNRGIRLFKLRLKEWLS